MTAITYNDLVKDLPSDAYHGVSGTYSSSQLKAMLEDPELFYNMYVAKTIPRKSTSAMDVGTYVHTAVLEPEKLEEETAIFPGPIRRGKEWDKFGAENKGKVILTSNDVDVALDMIGAVNSSPIARSHLDGYEHEVSLFVEVYVMLEQERDESQIYHINKDGDIYRITSIGWVFTSSNKIDPDSIKEFGHKLILKVRADSINFEKKDISDVKTTTANPKDTREVQSAVNSYSYDLSAAFYLDLFSLGGHGDMKTFTWIFTSKTTKTSKTWRATEENILIGRAKWRKAIIDIAYYESNNWTFSDELGHLAPSDFQREWIRKFSE